MNKVSEVGKDSADTLDALGGHRVEMTVLIFLGQRVSLFLLTMRNVGVFECAETLVIVSDDCANCFDSDSFSSNSTVLCLCTRDKWVGAVEHNDDKLACLKIPFASHLLRTDVVNMLGAARAVKKARGRLLLGGASLFTAHTVATTNIG